MVMMGAGLFRTISQSERRCCSMVFCCLNVESTHRVSPAPHLFFVDLSIHHHRVSTICRRRTVLLARGGCVVCSRTYSNPSPHIICCVCQLVVVVAYFCEYNVKFYPVPCAFSSLFDAFCVSFFLIRLGNYFLRQCSACFTFKYISVIDIFFYSYEILLLQTYRLDVLSTWFEGYSFVCMVDILR